MKHLVTILVVVLLFVSGCGGGSGPLPDNGVTAIMNDASFEEYLNSSPNDAYKNYLNGSANATTTTTVIVETTTNNTTSTINSEKGKPYNPNHGELIWINGYWRNGKWVSGYWRTKPNDTLTDNLRYNGN